jgi:hypothetical protein
MRLACSRAAVSWAWRAPSGSPAIRERDQSQAMANAAAAAMRATVMVISMAVILTPGKLTTRATPTL